MYVLIFKNRILFGTVTFKRVSPDFFFSSNTHHAKVIRILSESYYFPLQGTWVVGGGGNVAAELPYS